MASVGSRSFYADYERQGADGSVVPAQDKGSVLDYQELVDFVSDASVAELKELVAKGEFSVDEIVEAEKAGKNRKGVLALADHEENTDSAAKADDDDSLSA